MDIRFLEPGYLLLLVLVPLLWWVPRRALSRKHGLLRSMVLTALVIGLARPIAFVGETTEYHVFVVDGSASVATPAQGHMDAALARILAELPSRGRASLVSIGTDPESSAAGERFVERVALAGTGSSASAALAAASRLIPEGSRGAVTVLSDGAATDRRWGPAVQAMCSRGIPVHTVPVPGSPEGDLVHPVALRADEILRVGQTVRVYCDLVGRGVSVDARLFGPDGELDAVTGLGVDGRSTQVFEFEPEAAGFLPLRVEVTAPTGGDSGNGALSRTFAVQDPLRVLYLGERVVAGAEHLGQLLGSGFEIDTGVDLGGDGAAAQLDSYDLVFVDDRPAAAMPEAFQGQLVGAVTERGLGLMFAGGKSAFGPGGYHGTAIADALPVEAVQKEEKRDPSTTLVIIIDTSGSMGGMRVTLAKEVARLAMRRLLPHDKVGIVEFYGAKRWAAPIQPASNLIELQRALNRLDSGGGTVILPAIEEAFYGMQNVETRYKHVLILTDGGVETGAFEPLLRKMASKGVNVSTVLVGPDAHSEFLVTLSNWGKGRFYSVPNRFNLPEVILKQPASAQLPAYRPGEHAVRARGGYGWWGDADLRAVPPIAGYVETRSRTGSQTLLETEREHPVLSSWRYGLGRVTAFCTEPTGPGTATWQGWAGYGPWMARVLTRTAWDGRQAFDFTLDRRDHQLTLSAQRVDGGDARPRAKVLAAGGRQPRDLPFRERAPGHFVAKFVWPPELEARLLAGTEGRSESEVRLCSSAHDDESAELQVDPDNGIDLSILAAATGGNTLRLSDVTAADLPTGGGRGAVALFELWPWFLLLALLIYLGELLYRRLPPREVA